MWRYNVDSHTRQLARIVVEAEKLIGEMGGHCVISGTLAVGLVGGVFGRVALVARVCF